MGSVVKGLSMSDVRHCLHQIRRAWDDQTPWKPFDPTVVVTPRLDLTMVEFAWLFVVGHHAHRKRTKTSAAKATSEETMTG